MQPNVQKLATRQTYLPAWCTLGHTSHCPSRSDRKRPGHGRYSDDARPWRLASTTYLFILAPHTTNVTDPPRVM